MTIVDLEQQLNDFDLAKRTAALLRLQRLDEDGNLDLPEPDEIANMHCHTFFSFNGYGYSPIALAWLAKRRGIKLMGVVDFDVLDAVDEFLDACRLMGLRGSAGIETRVFIPEFADRVINSPGEPGVYYHMGLGFTTRHVPNSAAPLLADMHRRAVQRNRELLARINAHLDPVTINYDQDVVSLTPQGNVTERHILAAYLRAVTEQVADPVTFWAEKLALSGERLKTDMANSLKFQSMVRAKLMKQGGVGYIQPGPTTFPTIDSFHKFILACGALPCATWLDGTSAGEAAMDELLEHLIDQGVVALNIIPDRNWNIADSETKQLKLRNLYKVVRLAQQLDLPLNVGTEMNAGGQKLVDDFHTAELAPLRDVFMDGAYFVYGHTVAQRARGLGYQSEWAKTFLPARRERNAFYTALGRRVEPDHPGKLAYWSQELAPDEVLAKLAA